MLKRLGYFVTESSEHFAEYTPYFIKEGREDIIEKFGIPLDEYPKRCVEQIARWKKDAAEFKSAEKIHVEASNEYASYIVNSIWTGEPSVIYGNQRNNGCITSLPDDCAAEVPCLVDDRGIQPTYVGDLPPQLTALIRTNINVQELTVRALVDQNREHIYHAAMMDPHTAAELDLQQIWDLTDDLLAPTATGCRNLRACISPGKPQNDQPFRHRWWRNGGLACSLDVAGCIEAAEGGRHDHCC